MASPSTERRSLFDMLGWRRDSFILLGAFVAVCVLIVIVWWPLTEMYLSYLSLLIEYDLFWRYADWLLLGIWLVMALLIMAGADLKADAPLLLVALAGGLIIEAWGTQTELWVYYTAERPPLWIIPAWPVAALSVARLASFADARLPAAGDDNRWLKAAYWLIFPGFLVLMLAFTAPTLNKSLTVAAVVFTTLLIATPRDLRRTLLLCGCGVGLGYFLELWGTTRLCWTYYTGQQPPLFAVLAHGLASVAFWRVEMLFKGLRLPALPWGAHLPRGQS